MYIHIISQELGEHNKNNNDFYFYNYTDNISLRAARALKKPCPRPIPPPRLPVFYSLMALSLLPPGHVELCAAAGLI